MIDYFRDIDCLHWQHIPSCEAWIDRRFDDYFALNFACAGRISFALGGGKAQVLSAPVAWWTWPGEYFRYGMIRQEPWDHYFVTFSGADTQTMVESGLLPCDEKPFRFLSDDQRFKETFDKLLQSLSLRPSRNPRAILLLEDLLLQLHEQQAPDEAVGSSEKAIASVIARIREAPWNSVDQTREAEACNVSTVHFRRLFKQRTGLPPGQFRLHLLLDFAARQLRSTDKPIKQIADECGYEDVYHFTKRFRKRFRIPPGAYRKEFRPDRGDSSH